jgi:hypothetical protein
LGMWFALLVAAVVVTPLFPGPHVVTRGKRTRRRGKVYMRCDGCLEGEWYRKLPPTDDDSAWICKNPVHGGKWPERVGVYPASPG